MENHGGMISTGKCSWFVYRSTLAIVRPESSSIKAGGTAEGHAFCFTNYLLNTSKDSLTCVKT